MRQVVNIHFPLVDKYVNCGRGNVDKLRAVIVTISLHGPHFKKKKKKKGKKLSKKIKIMSKATKKIIVIVKSC